MSVNVSSLWLFVLLIFFLALTRFALPPYSYSREIPSRFKKEVLLPYADPDGTVNIEDVNRLFKNIGHSGDCFSQQEQQELLAEAGSKDRSISVSKMMELIG